MVPRIPRLPKRSPSFLARWWQPGVYGSVPAVALWILARLPAGLLMSLAGTPAAATWLNQSGDTVFVAGWAASALLLWLTRHRAEPAAPTSVAMPATSDAPPSRPSRHPAG